ncbi:hypothetical protein [Haloferula rosea]|uniref:Uncharacterized protein n=1 Tax=Haloferula rosea TaxID=490093 RepID=A0A934VFP0_9BACT|nr:hypothetical protein [Haloferula rosea]MBK1827192.1 hypothetical protein [Haloferula rosea]
MPETLEAEVIEIDGKAPEPAENRSSSESYSERARQMVFQLDRRWWPLWLVLGVVAVALLLTVGVVVGVFFLIVTMVKRILLAFASALSGSPR